jgi:hypothetical protein
MTFNPAVPLNSDSPGIYPAQNQVNMARLQTIISADHQFNLTAAANDGYHNLIHLTQQAPAGALAATGRVYAKTVSGLVQLFYMDDAGTEYQITPASAGPTPTKVTGSVALAGNATSGTIYTIPNNSQGTIFVNYIVPAGNFYRYYLFYKSGGSFVDAGLVLASSNTSRPDISISGSNIRVVNGNSSARTVAYYINVVSI